MVKVITATHKLNCDHLQGTFVDKQHYDVLIEEDVDCYMPKSIHLSNDKENEELRIAFKFRKNYFPVDQQKKAYEGLKGAAT